MAKLGVVKKFGGWWKAWVLASHYKLWIWILLVKVYEQPRIGFYMYNWIRFTNGFATKTYIKTLNHFELKPSNLIKGIEGVKSPKYMLEFFLKKLLLQYQNNMKKINQCWRMKHLIHSQIRLFFCNFRRLLDCLKTLLLLMEILSLKTVSLIVL